MGLEEEGKALARGQVPKSESFRKQRSVGDPAQLAFSQRNQQPLNRKDR